MDVPLIALLWRVRTAALPMPYVNTVPAQTVGRWSLGIARPGVPQGRAKNTPCGTPSFSDLSLLEDGIVC